jgi:urease accessory protein
MNSTMRLWQLISPALPVGAFHFSQALEQAVEARWVIDDDSAEAWLQGVLRHSIATVDLPLLKRVYLAWIDNDIEQVSHWNAVSRACRETSELRDEELQMGKTLTDLARQMNEPMPEHSLGFTAAFAILAANNDIDLREAMLGYAWAWTENQVITAVKLVPLGHRAGQVLLRKMSTDLDAIVSEAMSLADAEIGVSAPGFVLASSRHETQYTRLYRS